MATLKFDLQTVHYDIVDADKRYKVVIAGRRFNKTGMILAGMAKHLTQPVSNVSTGEPLPHSLSYIAPTRVQAKAIFWERAKTVLSPLIKKVNESDLIITFKNDGLLRLWGSDVNPDKARGGYDSFQAFDEFPFHKPGVYETVFRAKQSDTQGEAWFVGSPNGFNHGYQFWKRGQTEPDYQSWQYPSVQGGYITEAEVYAAKRDMSETKWRQEYLAEFVGQENRVVLDWSYLNVDTEVQYDPEKRIYISCDFNVNPMCWALFHRVNGEYLFFDEIALRNVNVQKAAEVVAERYQHHKNGIIITGDYSGKNRNYLQNKLSETAYVQMVNAFNAAGIPDVGIDLKSGNPPVQDRIDSFNRMVKNAMGEALIRVNPITCPVILLTMENAQRIPGSSKVYEPTAKDIENQPDLMFVPHMLDAVSYATNRYNPIEKKIDGQKAPSMNPVRHRA
jgi:hypothetical protein